MKEEDKELLLVDLCARLPYGVTVEIISYGQENLKPWVGKLYCKDLDCFIHDIAYKSVKPYLRPMSSITDEEIDMMWDISENYSEAESSSKITDLLNKWNLDHHHLIEKGLAIAVTEENNPYEDRKYSNTKAH